MRLNPLQLRYSIPSGLLTRHELKHLLMVQLLSKIQIALGELTAYAGWASELDFERASSGASPAAPVSVRRNDRFGVLSFKNAQ